MEPAYQNKQDLLARQFHLMEVSVYRASHEAILAIRRLKFISKIPLADDRIRVETEETLKQAVFSYISPGWLLLEEGYYADTVKN